MADPLSSRRARSRRGGKRFQEARKPRRAFLIAFAGVMGLSASGRAQAQLQGQVETILNIVNTRRGSAPFHKAVLREPLATGDNIRTGDRSKASVLFSDRSLLKINALSNVVIRTGVNQRDVNIGSGRVYGDYKGPGRFRGRFATAAVRGTQLEVEETPTRTIVRCFQGSVVVVASNVDVVTGPVDLGFLNSFQSTALVGETANYIGGRVYIVAGAQAGQRRTVVAFDPVTGTATLDAPLPAAPDTTSRFVLVNPPDAPLVTLTPGFETYVSNTLGTPSAPTPTAPLTFIGGDELAWTEDGFSGNQQSHLTGFNHDAFRSRNFEIDEARDTSQVYRGIAPGIQPLSMERTLISTSPGTGGVGVGVGNGTGGIGIGTGTGTGGIGIGTGTGTGGVGIGTGSGTGGIGIGTGTGTGGIAVTIGRDISRAITLKPPSGGAAAFTTENSDSSLAYAHASGVLNKLFFRVGGRIGSLSHTTGSALDEALVRYRDRRAGDFQAGRFHWFPGPVSNGELGRLVSFTTVDGLLWRLPTGETNQVQLGYFPRINPLRGPSVGGYTARWSLPAAQGRIGGSVLGSNFHGSVPGYSGDAVYPVLPQKLELYGELGRDTLRHGFYAIGAYFPGFYHAIHADAYLEYSFRGGGIGGSFDFNVHVPVTRNFGALLTLSKPGASSFRPGIGVTASF